MLISSSILVRTDARLYWLISGFLMKFSSGFGQTFFIALFAVQIRQSLQLSHADWGFFYTVATIVSAILLSQFGKSVDYYDAKYLVVIIFLGLGFFCVGMYFLSSEIQLFFFLLGLRFFGQGAVSHLASTSMARWFVAIRGRALAISALGMASAEALLPIFVSFLLLRFYWNEIWLFSASVVFVLIPILFGLLRRSPKIKELTKMRKERAAIADNVEDEENVRKKIAIKENYKKEVRTPLFWSLLLSLCLPSLIITVFFFQATYLVEVKSWSLIEFTEIYFFYSLSSIGASFLIGRLIDKVGAGCCLPAYLVPLMLGCLVVYGSENFWVGSLSFICFGFSAGAVMTIGPSLWAELYGTVFLGRIKAFSQSVMVLSTALGPGISGWLLEKNFGLGKQNFLFAGITLLFLGIYWITYSQLKMKFRED